ncbi:conserved hypothetical protein [Paecilomyces variotii No. 5]|uniref:F-box domain-containing protein n=1 Tax=Byssochlamys spectabilis (strain No. 5 / NBRC 109023) TaxID=1356009 RepID=V5G490_BYSSN|nr:conserved hypothetical protein [Paecilomyces variotii No. 5]
MASGIAYCLTRPSCEMLDYRIAWGKPKKLKLAPLEIPGMDQTNPDPPLVGFLGSMPLDIMYEVLMNLDYGSTGKVRLLNSSYRRLVDSFPAYGILKKHARQCLRVMRRVKIDLQWSVGQIFTEMCSPRCRTCTDFGPFLFLPTCSRCCYSCLRSRDEYAMAYLSTLKAIFALPESAVERLVAVENVPSCSPMNAVRYKIRFCPCLPLASVRQAYETSLDIYGDEFQLGQAVKHFNKEWRREWDEHLRQGVCYTADGRLVTDMFPSSSDHLSRGPEVQNHNFCYTAEGRLIERPPVLKQIDQMKRIIFDQYRPQKAELISTFLPFWNTRTQTAEPGMYCSACGYLWSVSQCPTPQDIRLFQRAYLSIEIQTHFAECEATKEGFRQHNWKRESRFRRPETYQSTNEDFLITGNIAQAPPLTPQKRKRKRRVSRA